MDIFLIIYRSVVYEYEPVMGEIGLAFMQSATWAPPPPNNAEFVNMLCGDYSFQAIAGDGTSALLYSDNVLYNCWWSGQ